MKKPWVIGYLLSAQQRLIRLGRCPGLSESLLGAHVSLLVLSCSRIILFSPAADEARNQFNDAEGKLRNVEDRIKYVFLYFTIKSVRDVASVIISHDQTQSNWICCFQTLHAVRISKGSLFRLARHGSSIGSVFACHASGPEFDPNAQHILSWRLGHENIPMAILPLPLIQEKQLSVSGERICTKYW